MPQPPPIRDGFFNIYVEKIDNLLMSLSIPPLCYMCEEKFVPDDKARVIRIRGIPHRFCYGCYDRLIVGLFIFNKGHDTVEPVNSGLQ